jgi:RNA polymerase sigma-70 factor (ECF subfamily)
MRTIHPSTTDEDLLALYQNNGDEHAFARLIDRYRGPILVFLSKRITDPAQVEELWQDTLYRVARSHTSYNPAYRFSTWIHTIAANLVKNHYRDSSRRREINFSMLAGPSRHQDAPPPFDPVDSADTPDIATYRSELRTAVHSMLNRLEPLHRTPLVMREFEDRSYEEIAEELGIPVGTVKSRLNRARTAFRTLFERHVEPQPTF